MEPLPIAVKPEESKEPNVFSKPWKNSDIILVVDNEEFHVHRNILCLQSPVFEAMLNGAFKEANQAKIELEEGDPDEITDFLKLLYPHKMFDDSSLNDGNILKMLALADKYQTEALIRQCFEVIAVTCDNALQVLPYANRYTDEPVRDECIRVATRQVRCQKLKDTLPKLEQKLADEILLGKCELLEGIAQLSRRYLLACLEKMSATRYKMKAEGQCCFSHQVEVDKFSQARRCDACLVVYKKRFCVIDSVYDGGLLKLLKVLHEVLHEVDLQEKTKHDFN